MNLKNIYLKIACLLILAKTYFYFFSSIWFSKNKQVKSFLFIFVWKGKNLFFYRTNVPFRTAQWKISLKAKFQSRHWQKTNDFSLGKGKTAFSQNFGKLAFFGNRNPTNVSFEYFSVHFFRIEKTKQILWKWKSLDIFKTNENSEKGTYMISPCTSQKKKKKGLSLSKNYPWRCLCLGFVQITMTVPFRRIKRHFVQIFFTEERTFIRIFKRNQKINCVFSTRFSNFQKNI